MLILIFDIWKNLFLVTAGAKQVNASISGIKNSTVQHSTVL